MGTGAAGAAGSAATDPSQLNRVSALGFDLLVVQETGRTGPVRVSITIETDLRGQGLAIDRGMEERFAKEETPPARLHFGRHVVGGYDHHVHVGQPVHGHGLNGVRVDPDAGAGADGLTLAAGMLGLEGAEGGIAEEPDAFGQRSS